MRAALFAALLLLPGTASAQASDPVSARLEAMAMRITLLATDRAPVVQARFDGGMFYVAQCEAPPACRVFYASFRPARPVTPAAVLAWNAMHPEVHASIDKAGHPALERVFHGGDMQEPSAIANATRSWLRDFIAFRDFVFARP